MHLADYNDLPILPLCGRKFVQLVEFVSFEEQIQTLGKFASYVAFWGELGVQGVLIGIGSSRAQYDGRTFQS